MKAKIAIFAAAVATVASGICAANANAYEYEYISDSSADPVLLNALYDATFYMKDDGMVPKKESYMGSDVLLGSLSKVVAIEFDCSKGDPLANVESYKGIEYFSSLESLALCTAARIDFNKLAEIPTLESLAIGNEDDDPIIIDDMSYDDMESLYGIQNLTNLKYLDVYRRPLGTLLGVTDSDSLIGIDIDGCGIYDIDGLQDMDSLRNVYLQNNEIADISPLVEFCVDRGICSNNDSTRSFFDNDIYHSIYGNVIRAKAVKGWTYEFDETIEYISSVLFAKSPKVVATGVTLDKEAGTVILNEDFGKIEIYDWNDQNKVYFTIEIYAYGEGESSENPNTFDSSLAYLIGGIAASALAGFGILSAIKARR